MTFRLSELTYPLSYDTLGKLMAGGYEVMVHCHTEGYRRCERVNLVMLARRLGMDHPSLAKDLLPYLYCAECREAGRPDRDLSLTLHAPTDPHSDWPQGTGPRMKTM